MTTREARRLNLDDYIPAAAYVILDGIEHEIAARSVQVWLNFLKGREELEAMVNDDTPNAERAEALMNGNIDIIVMVCPTVTRERLLRLSLEAIQKFTQFIAEEMRGLVETEEDEEGSGEGEEKAVGEAESPTTAVG